MNHLDPEPPERATSRHFLSVEDLTNEEVLALVGRARELKAGQPARVEPGHTAINMFFENSTRTMTSFQMAEHRLGMKVLDFDPGHSSLTKGETLYDSVRTVDAIGAEVAVIRHSTNHYYDHLLAPGNLGLSLVNGGDGSGQHPSQCMLDLMTIAEEFGHFDGLTVAISGDIAHSRVARSDAQILTRLGAHVVFTGPREWMDHDLTRYGSIATLEEIIDSVDVAMMLRVQHERFDAGPDFLAADYLAAFGLTDERAARMRPGAIIMHPAPVNRGCEISGHLVEAPNSRIFPAMANGVWARMAILERVLLSARDERREEAGQCVPC